VEGRVENHVGTGVVDRPGPERIDVLIQRLADATDLGARDSVDPERLDEVINLAGRHSLDVGLDHHRMQRLLGPSAGLQKAWEVAARGDLGDLELDRADARVPRSCPVAVAVGGSVVGPLVWQRSDLSRNLSLHEGLGQHLDAFPQDISVVFLEKLAYEGRDVHPGLGHCHLLI
jgi:hypothetical protein